MDYDSYAENPITIRTEPIGSIPRSAHLLEAMFTSRETAFEKIRKRVAGTGTALAAATLGERHAG
jgi:hypothetical protein